MHLIRAHLRDIAISVGMQHQKRTISPLRMARMMFHLQQLNRLAGGKNQDINISLGLGMNIALEEQEKRKNGN